MGKLRKLFVGIAVLGVLFSWATDYKTPEGFQEPWKLKMFFTVFQTLMKIEKISQSFGYKGALMRSVEPDFSPPPDSVSREVAILAGVRTVIYRPVGASKVLPAMVYYHGGGWVSSSPEVTEDLTSHFVDDLKIVVFSVDYRLAPENPYPAPFEDCYKVAQYVTNNAEKLKVDPKRISLGGDSAGGNLAAAVSTKFRDEGKGNKIKMQLLMYPVMQSLDFQTKSYEENQDDGLLSRNSMVAFWNKYALGYEDYVAELINNTHISEEETKAFRKLCGNSKLLSDNINTAVNSKLWAKFKYLNKDPYFSPLVAKDLTGMPPSIIVNPEQDVLKDDGFLYAKRLRESGIVVVHHHLKESFHGILAMGPVLRIDFQRAYDRIAPDVKKFV